MLPNAMTPAEAAKDIYQIKVTLDNAHLPIWRRVLVPSTYTFSDLHMLIQAAYGWQNCHLHQFSISLEANKKIFIVGQDVENDYDANEVSSEIRMDELSTTLADVIPKMAKELKYEYDFGDSWSHTLVLERKIGCETNRRYPACIDGESAGPPEDCGGVSGYEQLCRVMMNPDNAEYKETLKWLGIKSGEGYDPRRLDFSEINTRLASESREQLA